MLLYGINYAIMVMFQVLEHRNMSIAVSVLQPLCVLALPFTLTPMDPELLWASFWLGELVVLVVVAVASAVIRRRDDNLTGLLLNRDPEIPTMTLSV